MKLYTKIIDGHVHTLPKNKIVVIKDDMQIFNPTEEMIVSDGWRLHTASNNELTEEQILVQEKESKVNDILEYDSSSEVNVFYVNNVQMWLDKVTRSGLVGRLNSELKRNKLLTTLWYEHIKFELPTELAISLLIDLEIYASECYDMTQQHVANVLQITSLEELKAYDYKTGYPDILHFTF